MTLYRHSCEMQGEQGDMFYNPENKSWLLNYTAANKYDRNVYVTVNMPVNFCPWCGERLMTDSEGGEE